MPHDPLAGANDPTLPPPAPPGDAVTLAPGEAGGVASPATLVPGYEILGELGRGGMGVVYKARQLSLNRTVALKMILAGGHAGAAELTRFRAEAEAIARLAHPGIVQIYEVGEHEGRPFFSLEFCGGGSLEQALNGAPLPPAGAAELVETLAGAMHAAHAAGIVHRDLKPANVLLRKKSEIRNSKSEQHNKAGESAEESSPGLISDVEFRISDFEPKVTDFGLAKKLGEVGQTQTGAIMGTPSYMAPEQAEGKKEIGPVADVYALGAILYECLTGRPPFRAATSVDTILQVIGQEPVPPRRLSPSVPRDLEVICLKCLEKSPGSRYATAEALAEELAAYREGKPIRARPISAPQRAWRWCRRKPLAAALLGVLAVVVLGLATGGPLVALRQAQLRDDAERSEQMAVRAAGEAERARAGLEEEQRQAVRRLYVTRVGLGHREWSAGNISSAETLLESCPVGLRGWEWHFVKQRCNDDLRTLRSHAGLLSIVRYSPDGKRLVTAGSDGFLRVWDVEAGVVLFSSAVQGGVVRLAFTPDGQHLATVGRNGVAVIWNLEAGYAQFGVQHGQQSLVGVGWLDEGRQFWTASLDGTVKTWDASTGKERSTLPRKLELDALRGQQYRGQGVASSRDGKYLAAGGLDCLVRVWDAATGEPVLNKPAHLYNISTPAFSPDGKLLATPGGEGVVKLWDVASGELLRTFTGHGSFVETVCFSPDGKRLASGSRDFAIKLWEVESGRELTTLHGHSSEVWGLDFSPDGRRLVSASADGSAKVWDVAPRVHLAAHAARFVERRDDARFFLHGNQEVRTFIGHLGTITGLCFSPDGRLLATAAPSNLKAEGTSDNLRVWDLGSGQVHADHQLPPAQSYRLAFSPDGGRLFAGCSDGGEHPATLLAIPAAAAGDVVRAPLPPCDHAAVEVSPDGKVLLVALLGLSGKGVLQLREATSLKLLRTVTVEQPLVGAAFTDRGRKLATASVHGWVRLFDATTGQLVAGHHANESGLELGLAVSRDGLIAVATRDPIIRLLDPTTGRQLRTLEGHAGMVTGMAFSPDGRRLVTGASDLTVKVWDVESGLTLLTFRQHRLPVRDVAWSPDGLRVASAGLEGLTQLWETRPAPQPPTGDDWPVLFRDDFDGGALGPAWAQRLGRWSVEDGAARGDLGTAPLQGGTFGAAMLALVGQSLPEVVDVRCDCWSPKSILASLMLTERRPSGEPSLRVQAVLAGSEAPFGKGATTIHMRNEQMGGRGVLRPAAFEPGKRHRLRLLRDHDHLTLWLDGQEVLTERITAEAMPELGLLGAWAALEDRIYFDNVEIRAPQQAIDRERLRGRVEESFRRTLLKANVRRALAEDTSLSGADRETALAMVDRLQEDREALVQAARETVFRAGRPEQDYRLALEQVTVARKRSLLSPESAEALGWALLRLGKKDEARAVFEGALARAEREEGAGRPALHAGLALLSGDTEAGRQHLRRLIYLMHSVYWAEQKPLAGLHEETVVALGPQEAEGEAGAVLRLVFEAERAGWQRLDLAGYMAVRAPELRAVTGRGPEPDQHDKVRDRAQEEAANRLMFSKPLPEGMRSFLRDCEVAVEGDQAVLRSSTVVQFPGGHHRYGSRVELKRTPQGWRITATRGWVEREWYGGYEVVRDARHWKVCDAEVETARKAGDRRKLALALCKAAREAEALPLLRELCAGDGAGAEDWVRRGEGAVTLGHADEARQCFAEALKVSASAPVPWYAK